MLLAQFKDSVKKVPKILESQKTDKIIKISEKEPDTSTIAKTNVAFTHSPEKTVIFDRQFFTSFFWGEW